jgi:Hydrolase N-terminal helical domain/Tuberculosis necrotizing toxin
MSRGLLVMFAGGDPWKVNATLQSGRPADIAALGQTFHNAGQSTQEADNAFAEARRRVDAWVRDNGQHPITDSAEVRRTAAGLGLQATQLPKIAVDLENVAAALGQAQGAANGYIAALEARLQTLDDWIGQADDLIKQDEQLLAEADDESDICDLEDDINRLEQYINDCEREAVDDTRATLQQIEKVRDDYTGELNNAKANLRTDGYDPAPIQALDGEDAKGQAPGDIPPSGLEASDLAGINRVMNQAVVDQMAKVRAAQKAVDDAMATAYTHGPGSSEGQAALQRLPELKKNLADALNELGKLPDYNNIDPSAMRSNADGSLLFGYNANGQPAQVTGKLKNGTGEIFDQGTGTYYTFQDGKLVGTRTPDPGRAEATDEPLLSAVTLAVGAPELKAGGEAAVQGFKALLERRAVGLGADITSENVLPQTFAAAESRAEAAAHNLATEHAPAPLPSGGTAEHPAPVTTSDHRAPATAHDPPVAAGGAHHSAPPPGLVAHPLPADSPLFDGYRPIEPGPEFTKADGSLNYPDDMLPSKPYAIPGTVIPDAHLTPGTVIDRFGWSTGSYLSPEGVPFAERALDPDSALKPYCQYIVDDPAKLPPGYHIEESQAAPWFHQPGGGMQYRIIGPDGKNAPVDALLDSGYLKDPSKR